MHTFTSLKLGCLQVGGSILLTLVLLGLAAIQRQLGGSSLAIEMAAEVGQSQ